MEHEIIHTENYLIIVNDDTLNGMEWCYGNNINNDGKKDIHRALSTDAASQQLSDKEKHSKKIIAHLPLNGASYLDGVDLLPEIEDENSIWNYGLEQELNKLPYTKHLDDGQYNDGQLAGFEIGSQWGYNKAKETYKYTEEDLRKAFKVGFSQGFASDIISSHKLPEKKEKLFVEYLQSLNQPKLPVAFECEMESTECPDNKPGCLVAHFGQAKITNSAGRTEWVGTYKFK